MLHTDDDFLRAIEADPRERTLRLAYADWLAEHDDPRGELVRVEEEMRTLPVFADRFWLMKLRRNELRAAAGAGWCGRMRYGTDCPPVFGHGIPGGWRERWRLIREFTERWHGVPMPDVGGRQKEIAEAEARLGRTLPPSVREWIAFVADVRASGHSGELQPATFGPLDGTDGLSLWLITDAEDYYGDAAWAVLTADLHHPDPPVYSFYFWGDETGATGWARVGDKPEAPAVTAFALGRVVGTAAGASGFVATLDQLADLYRHLRRWSVSYVEFGGCEWDEADNLLVEVLPIPAQRGKFHLTVVAAPAVRREEVPEFLWQYARLSENAHGVFAKPG